MSKRQYKDINKPTLQTHNIFWQSTHELPSGGKLSVGSIINENGERVCEVTTFSSRTVNEIESVTGFFNDVEVTNTETGYVTQKKALS